MKTYIQPATEIIRVNNYLCQAAASPVDDGYHPLTPTGQGGSQSGAM